MLADARPLGRYLDLVSMTLVSLLWKKIVYLQAVSRISGSQLKDTLLEREEERDIGDSLPFMQQKQQHCFHSLTYYDPIPHFSQLIFHLHHVCEPP